MEALARLFREFLAILRERGQDGAGDGRVELGPVLPGLPPVERGPGVNENAQPAPSGCWVQPPLVGKPHWLVVG